MDDYRNWASVEDLANVDQSTQDQSTTGLELLMRKGVYPYEWMNDDEKLYTTSLPPKECFHSELYNDDTSDEEYEHVHKVWDHFEGETFEDYHNLYLKTDVLLLRDVSEMCYCSVSILSNNVLFYKIRVLYQLSCLELPIGLRISLSKKTRF